MYKPRHSYLLDDSLPQALPLPSKTYSLESDMLFGWRPKFIKSPLPLSFPSDSYKASIPSSSPVVYKAYKAQNSFSLHQDLLRLYPELYPYDSSDKSITAYKFLNKNSTARQYGMTHNSEGSLVFDSFFECGNLDKVEMLSPTEYDVYIRPDSNTSTHMHWFYFSVTGFRTLAKVKLNVVNFSRSSSLFAAGMRPKLFSQAKSGQDSNYDWQDVGENVSFGYSKINKYVESGKDFFMLSFDFCPAGRDDKVWLATTVPYTYSRLWKVIKLVQADERTYETSHVRVESLGKSLGLADIPVVSVTNPFSSAKKQVVVAVARVHPSETVGSWVMEGFLRFVASRHPQCRRLRELFDFKLIPMCNPDGVIIGNSRTNLNGNDLNRCYARPDEASQPEAKLVKQFIQGLLQSQVFMFIDFHGHFCKKGSFLYGPCYPLHDLNYFYTKIIAKLLSERTQIFRYHSSRFVVDKGKNSTARVVMWKELGIVNAFTLETSYFGFINDERETVAFETHHLYELAEQLALSIYEFFVMQSQEKVAVRVKVDKGRAQTRTVERRPEEGFDGEVNSEQFWQERSKTGPWDKLLPLSKLSGCVKQRSFNEIVEMIKAESASEESDSAESDSEGDEPRETELPKIERVEPEGKKDAFSARSGKPKLRQEFIRRIERIKKRRKREATVEVNLDDKNCFRARLPAIISSANANRSLPEKF